MQGLTYLFFGLALSAATSFDAAAVAADLPKESTFNFTYSGFATFKAIAVGKERVLIAWNDNGLSLGEGIMDHVTWYGFGSDDITGATEQTRGYYVSTDRDGDQIVANMVETVGAVGAKKFSGTANLTTGTGKYIGISGSYTYVCISPGEFRTAAEGTMVLSCTSRGSYTIP